MTGKSAFGFRYQQDFLSPEMFEMFLFPTTVFLNRQAAARYQALASIIPGRERFSWN
jgi:hypothetical protein